MGVTLRFLTALGEQLIFAILFFVFLALCAFVAYRFYKGNISTVGILSDVVIFGLFLTPPTSLGAFCGSLLASVWEPAWYVLTAVGAAIGLFFGLYAWSEWR